MSKRSSKLSSLEKAYMVRHIFLADSIGMKERDLAERRKWLAEKFDVDVRRVGAITAWFRIRAGRAVPGVLSDDDFDFIRSYTGLADGEEERIRLQEELSRMLKVDMAEIQHVTDGMREESQQLLSEDLSGTSRGKVHRSKSGEHIDYSSAIKEKWRQTWKTFIDEKIPQERRGRMKVLCLPGKKCLEIPLYLELGFKPENILGVEGGDRIARADFEMYAKSYGIDYRLGRLEDILPTCKTRFGVVSLDFIGQICPGYIKIFSNLLLEEQSAVMINTRARRENAAIQSDLQWMWEVTAQGHADISQVQLNHQRLYGGNADTEMQITQPDWNLPNARDKVSPALVSAGIARKENWYFGGKAADLPLLPQISPESTGMERAKIQHNIETALLPMVHQILKLFHDYDLFNKKEWEEVQMLSNIVAMFHDALFGNKYVKEMQKYSYNSESSSVHSPFNTDMAILHMPRNLYGDIAPAVDFLFSCVSKSLHMAKEQQDPTVPDRFRFAIVRDRTTFVKPGDAKKSDKIACLIDGMIIEMKQIFVIFNALKAHHEFRKNYPLDDWNEQMKIPRNIIE